MICTEILNGLSLCEALCRCEDNKDYKVIVAFSTRARMNEFAESMAELHRYALDSRFNKVSKTKISFKNGSYIQLIPATEYSARGRRCNEILYDDEVPIENADVYNALKRMLTPYRCGNYESIDGTPVTEVAKIINQTRWYKKYEEDKLRQNDEALDKFLNSFKVNP